MKKLEQELCCRKIIVDKLLAYGFVKDGDIYVYEKNLSISGFKMIVVVNNDKMSSKVIDTDLNEEYLLVDVVDSSGEFVGKIKEEYEAILSDIIDKCTNFEVFREKQTKLVIKYIKDKYNDELEFLWKKFDDNAVWRNKKNNKWYGALLIVNGSKVGYSFEEMVEIIDLRYQKDKIKEIIDNKYIFPGYHMNKNNWITIRLDDSVNIEKIFELIDNSYEISLNKK